jgi:hypothetical protein
MTDPDELRRLRANATPGNVVTFDDGVFWGEIRSCETFQEIAVFPQLDDRTDDFKYLAAAWNAIPELLDALEAARKDAAELRDELKLWKPMTEEEAEAAYEEAEAVPLEPGEIEAMVERMLAKVNDPAYRPTEPEYVRLTYMIQKLQEQQTECLLAIATARMQRDAAHSIIADLRRQLAGLGIPTGEKQ